MHPRGNAFRAPAVKNFGMPWSPPQYLVCGWKLVGMPNTGRPIFFSYRVTDSGKGQEAENVYFLSQRTGSVIPFSQPSNQGVRFGRPKGNLPKDQYTFIVHMPHGQVSAQKPQAMHFSSSETYS